MTTSGILDYIATIIYIYYIYRYDNSESCSRHGCINIPYVDVCRITMGHGISAVIFTAHVLFMPLFGAGFSCGTLANCGSNVKCLASSVGHYSAHSVPKQRWLDSV